MHFLYILASRPNGTLYTGITSDIAARVQSHKDKLVQGFTKRYGITRLVYYQEFQTALEAAEAERRIKRWRRDWKIKLIEDLNPYWEDLYYKIL